MISIPLRPIPIRILFLLLISAAIGVLVWFVARTAIGGSVMTFVERAPNLAVEAQIEGADMAVKFAPRDPLIHWQRGGVYLHASDIELQESRLLTALEELQQAVKMSPGDYRLWLSLGRALDRNSSTPEEVEAVRKAI